MTNTLDKVIELINSMECKTEEESNFRKRVIAKLKSSNLKGKAGRPALTYPNNWKEVYSSWKANEITAKEAMIRTDLKRTSFYKLVKMYE